MDLSLLDRADPGAWYLDSPEYAELADVQLVVEGRPLPAHGAVLARASPLLRDLLRDQRRGIVAAEGPPARTRGRRRAGSSSSSSMLRLVYHPSDANKEGFKAIGVRLAGVLRLAHQLELEALVASITDFVGTSSSSSGELSLEQLAEWATLAERLHLDALMARCVRALAAHLLQHTAQAPFAAVASLPAHISSTCLRAVLSALVTAGRYSADAMASALPAASDLAKWQQEPGAQPRTPFIWKLTGARAKLQGSNNILSEPFMRGGRQWRVYVKPGEQVGVYLQLMDVGDKGAAAAYFSVTIRNQVCARALVLSARGHKRTTRHFAIGAQAGKPDKCSSAAKPDVFTRTATNWGWAEFISRSGKPVCTLGACCQRQHSLCPPPIAPPDLLDPCSGWVVDDTLLLECEVWDVEARPDES